MMRFTLLNCLLFCLWASTAQPVAKKHQINGIWKCLPPAPTSNLAEDYLAEMVRSYVVRWNYATRDESKIDTFADLVSKANCEAQRPLKGDKSFVSSVSSQKWDEWLQMCADLVLTFWCMKPGKGYASCRDKAQTVFGRQPKPLSPQFVSQLYSEACQSSSTAGGTKSSSSKGGARPDVSEAARLPWVEAYWKTCAVEGLEAMMKKIPMGQHPDEKKKRVWQRPVDAQLGPDVGGKKRGEDDGLNKSERTTFLDIDPFRLMLSLGQSMQKYLLGGAREMPAKRVGKPADQQFGPFRRLGMARLRGLP